MDVSKKSGSSTDGIYESHLYYFQEMSFLDSVVSLRNTCSNLNTGSVELASEALNLNSTFTDSTFEEQKAGTSEGSFIRSPSPSPPISLTPLSTPSPESSLASSSSSGSQNFSSRNHSKEAKFITAVNAIIASVKAVEPEDVYTSFAKTIALQLRDLPLPVATRTMSEIHNHVTEVVLAQMKAPQRTVAQQQDILTTAVYEAEIE